MKRRTLLKMLAAVPGFGWMNYLMPKHGPAETISAEYVSKLYDVPDRFLESKVRVLDEVELIHFWLSDPIEVGAAEEQQGWRQ